LDYKGFSNAGTWFIGRLQTERDKARVIDGLLSASGEGLDKSVLEKLLANLGNRVFLMRNAHEAAPVLFRTRWALSYLRGPMTLKEISSVSGNRAPLEAHPASTSSATKSAPSNRSKPVVPAGIAEYFVRTPTPNATYAPRVLAIAKLHFVEKASGVDSWETRSFVAPLANDEESVDWQQADTSADLTNQLLSQAPSGSVYSNTPGAYLRATNYGAWQKQFLSHLAETATRDAYKASGVDIGTGPAASEREYRARIALALREKRDAQIETLRQKYAARLQTLDDQLRRADERIQRERAQLSDQKMQTAISVGSSILGALFGRKLTASTMSRMGSAARGAGRITRESGDVDRAQESRDVLQQRKIDLENELEQEVAQLKAALNPDSIELQKIAVPARGTDTQILKFGLVWVPVA
jgi:hypothetical protein